MREDIFCYIGTNVANEKIFRYYNESGNVYYQEIGNRYNLVDFINDCTTDKTMVELVGFNDKIRAFIISGIIRNKMISILSCNKFIAKGNKSKIRGKRND